MLNWAKLTQKASQYYLKFSSPFSQAAIKEQSFSDVSNLPRPIKKPAPKLVPSRIYQSPPLNSFFLRQIPFNPSPKICQLQPDPKLKKMKDQEYSWRVVMRLVTLTSPPFLRLKVSARIGRPAYLQNCRPLALASNSTNCYSQLSNILAMSANLFMPPPPVTTILGFPSIFPLAVSRKLLKSSQWEFEQVCKCWLLPQMRTMIRIGLLQVWAPSSMRSGVAVSKAILLEVAPKSIPIHWHSTQAQVFIGIQYLRSLINPINYPTEYTSRCSLS